MYSPGGEGAEIIYALRNDDELSKAILNEIGKEGQIIRRYYQRRYPTDPTKDYYYILRLTGNTQPVLIEYGFIDNKSDLNKLKNNLLTYGEAVVRAVSEYAGIPYSSKEEIESNVYVVQKGDSLYQIANRYGVTVNELKAANNLVSNLLSIGQRLIIPAITPQPITPSEYVVYNVEKGDNLYSISREFNIDINDIIEFNQLSSTALSIGQQLLLPIEKEEEQIITDQYIVQLGDTLYGIAQKFNTTVDQIIKTNNLGNTILQVGDKLVIPEFSEIVQIEPQSTDFDNLTYIVQPGDTLYQISRKYNVPIDSIKQLNNLDSNILSINQQLYIPRTEGYITYYVKSGDNLYNIANQYNTSVDELKRINNLTSNLLSIGQVLLIPA